MNFSKKVIILTSIIIGGALLIGGAYFVRKAQKKNLTKKIYLAGGCFWGVEAYMKRIDGVIDVVSGYANGKTERPTYEDVIYRGTGHAETVQVTYNPEKIEELVSEFWNSFDRLPEILKEQGLNEDNSSWFLKQINWQNRKGK